MNKIRYILFAFLLTGAGCSDFLDQQPISSLASETFWKTTKDADLGMAAMYNALQNGLKNNFFDWGEGRTDNWNAGGTGQFQVDVSLNNISATIDEASWTVIYKPISIANIAIKYLPGIKELTAANRDHYLAQAYAMRALCYFYAVRVWGDVPLWLEPYEDVTINPKKPRTPANDVLKVVLADLDQAYSLVNKSVATPVWNINAGSILAIKMDVQMWMHDYQNAINTGNQLIALNRYSLVKGTSNPVTKPKEFRNETITEWKKIFTDPLNSKEAIWSLYWNYLEDGANGIGGRTGGTGNTSNFTIDPTIQGTFEANATSKRDIRRGQTYDTLKLITTAGIDAIWKYYISSSDGKIQYQVVSQCEVKMVLYRFADILLMQAEALNRLNFNTNKATVVGLLNQVHTRAALPAYNVTAFTTQDDLERAILAERQLEFIAEGKRWFDLVRTGRVIEIMDPVLKRRQLSRGFPQIGFGDPGKILFPIHRDILNANDLLQQNDAYK